LRQRLSHPSTFSRRETLGTLDSVTRREWNDLATVDERVDGRRVTWTRRVILALEAAVQRVDQVDALRQLVRAFKRTSERRLVAHANDPRGVVILHSWVDRISHSCSDEVECLVRSLRLVDSGMYIALFHDDDERGTSVVDAIIHRLRAIESLLEQAQRLGGGGSTPTAAETRENLIKSAEEEADKVCSQCASDCSDLSSERAGS
ncbi:hypothetical protein JCM11491_005805, partial [Sporobolomyces phaffii]